MEAEVKARDAVDIGWPQHRAPLPEVGNLQLCSIIWILTIFCEVAG
jgi:hypothetical protein